MAALTAGSALIGCGPSGPQANASVSFEIGGDCAECPAQRLDTLFRGVDGVLEARYTAAASDLTVRYDSTRVKPATLVGLLNDAGYDADDALALFPNVSDRCCTPSDPILDSLRRVDTLSLTRVQKAQLFALIAQARSSANDLELDDLDPDDEALLTDATVDSNIEEELGGVLEDDLLGGSNDDADSPDPMDDDDDDGLGLDADDEDPPAKTPAKTPKKAPAKKPAKADTAKKPAPKPPK